MDSQETVKAMRRTYEAVRPYANARQGAARLVVPGHELVFVDYSKHTQAEARNWPWGLFVPQQALLDCGPSETPHFLYLYHFTDGSCLGRVFRANAEEMVELSQSGLFHWENRPGWNIELRR